MEGNERAILCTYLTRDLPKYQREINTSWQIAPRDFLHKDRLASAINFLAMTTDKTAAAQENNDKRNV
jgi:hypothetical protein